MRLLLCAAVCAVSLCATVTDVAIAPSTTSIKQPHRITILDAKRLSFASIDGLKFSELSDLAYRKDTQVLYMVSDEGRLFRFKAQFGKRIEQLEPLGSATLAKKSGKKFRSWRNDSEGMTFDHKRNRLVISFEGKAKIGAFDDDGRRIKRYRLPKILKKTDNYRSKNKSLEALAWHPHYGLLTAAEWSLKKDHKKHQTIYSLRGKQWHFKAEPEPKSSTTAIEVMDDGNLLVLERSYRHMLAPLVVTLKKVYLNRIRNGLCRTEVLAKMSSADGWRIDNFEGLARVGKNRYVMISDDNDSLFQETLLVYFEVAE